MTSVTLREEERGTPRGILPVAKSSFEVWENHAEVHQIFKESWKGWVLPGHGDAYFDCGSKRYKGCLEVDLHNQAVLDDRDVVGKIFVKLYRRSCGRMECPICYEKACGKAAYKVEHRLEAWSRGRPIHVVVSPSKNDVYRLSFEDLRKKVYDVLKGVGVYGGSVIFHPFRKLNEDDESEVQHGVWYVSPHFHVIGYGWVHGIKQNYVKNGWVVKNVGVRKSVKATVMYQLSHCGVHEKKHSLTWFGRLSYNKLRVPRLEEEKELCPLCGSKLRLLLKIKHCEGLKEEEGDYYLDVGSFMYKPKYGDYG